MLEIRLDVRSMVGKATSVLYVIAQSHLRDKAGQYVPQLTLVLGLCMNKARVGQAVLYPRPRQ